MESLESRVYNLERDMTDVKVSQGQIFELTKQGNEIHARLSVTLDRLDSAFASMEKSMLLIQYDTTKHSEAIKKINDELECRKARESADDAKLKDELRRVDDKSKIDVAVWVKSNYERIVITLAAIGYILDRLFFN